MFTHAQIFWTCALGCIFTALCASRCPGAELRHAVLVSEYIYESAPFPECHASTIVESKGRLLAAWFGGTEEGHKDVGIWLAELKDRKWTAPREVATGVQTDHSRHPSWNPVLFQPRSGPLLLFYKVGPSPRTWWGMLTRSGDGGATWSTPERLPEGILGPIKNKPVQLANGDILCPSSTENEGWRVHFEILRDDGRRWLNTGPLNDPAQFGAIQPAVLVHPQGKLQAIGRSRQGKIFEIWSEDGGLTWGQMRATALPNPNSGIDAVTLKDGRHLVVYNHTPKGRSPLNVAVSGNGTDWEQTLVLESDRGEYSYPAVIQARNGLVHISYTWKRQRIKHVVIDPRRIGNASLLPGKG
jgi:predicted neuraminidase